MASTINLTASAKFGYGGKQYIARITGRDKKFTFSREFIDRKNGKRRENSEAVVDEVGLYMNCDLTSKGDKNESFAVIGYLRSADGTIPESSDSLVTTRISREEAMKIAKDMDAGQPAHTHPIIITKRNAGYAKTQATKATKEAATNPESQPKIVEIYDPCL